MGELVVPTSERMAEVEAEFVGDLLNSGRRRVADNRAEEVLVARREWESNTVGLFVPTARVRQVSEPDYTVDLQTWYDVLSTTGRDHYGYGRIFPGGQGDYEMKEVIAWLKGEPDSDWNFGDVDPNRFDFFCRANFGRQPGFMKFGYDFLQWHRRTGHSEQWRYVNTKKYETLVAVLGGKPYG